MIKIQNTSFSYPNEESDGIKEINLEIKGGECILLCGRSGCGKTTITRLINGLIPNFFSGQLSGKIDVNGMNIFASPMYEIAMQVGSVFQNPRTQFFNVDTDSEIAFGIENAAIHQAELATRVEQTAVDLGICNLLGRNIFELSGGEKQKIAFASVYAMNPNVYLLDEPSSNLDIASIHTLKKLLLLIKNQGKTILIAEHRLHYLMDLVDKIVYLSEGKTSGIYSPAELKNISEEKRKSMGLRALALGDCRLIHRLPTASPTVLEVKNLTLLYKKHLIIKNINMKVARGEIIAVVGRNGVGKTTFSRSICGLHKEYKGEFLWDNKPKSDKERKRLSDMVMQDVNYQLFAESVEAECSLGIENADLELIDKTLSELDLLPYRKHHPNTLSGGQKQRLAVAASMLSGKEILVFDEPTSGLDYDSMTQVASLIQKLSEMGKIIFIVTHDYEFICKACTRVIFFGEQQLLSDVNVLSKNENKIRSILGISNIPEVKELCYE